ncbi:MAG: lipid II flippase MurJ [Hydrogenophaga sp.]|nr:lipid II flippase MurJ [Hydrogenophaga sp.]
MFLRAGLVSLALLLASRLLGLLRESVQAAALGASGLADVAILMLTLPDLLTGILAAGALGYVLLPLWARQTNAAQGRTRARLTRWLLGAGLVAGSLLMLFPQLVVQLLAPGLSTEARASVSHALWWSALAMPMALLAALWTTRLQHLRDFTGMYGANLVVNSAVVAALLLIAWQGPPTWSEAVAVLGAGLALGSLARLAWLRWRMQRAEPVATPTRAPDGTPTEWPRTPVWLWALASAGLPLLLPLLGRSLASTAGEGALTTFNYAWKLVELPLVLAVQLVATLAFPGIARAFAGVGTPATHPLDAGDGSLQNARRGALRQAFVLAWVLACAAAAALAGTAPALAQLLFGWGRMSPEAVTLVAAWAQVGAWSLLPQALLAVLLTLMASTGRLRGAVLAYSGALLLLGALGWAATHAGAGSTQGVNGERIMWAINAALALAAVALLLREREFVRGALLFRDLLPAALAAALLAHAAGLWAPATRWAGLAWALGVAAAVVGAAWVMSPGLRQALRR